MPYRLDGTRKNQLYHGVKYTPGSSNILVAMDNKPFEDVFPIENGDIPAISMLVYRRVTSLSRVITTPQAVTHLFSVHL